MQYIYMEYFLFLTKVSYRIFKMNFQIELSFGTYVWNISDLLTKKIIMVANKFVVNLYRIIVLNIYPCKRD